MSVSYDVFTNAFLSKITEYDLLTMEKENQTLLVDNYMFQALNNSSFKKVCQYDFTDKDDTRRIFNLNIPEEDVFEISDIVSECMLIYWLKPYVYKQELLENILNTKDFSVYSPAELLLRVGNTYAKAQKDYINMVREYSYNHGDLSELHI